MNNKKRLAILMVLAVCIKTTLAQANIFPVFNVEQTKNEITLELSKDLRGSSQEQPILLLVGGYPGAGKTTLIKALSEKDGIAIISWDAVRQALQDRRLKGSPFDWEIIESVYQNLLRMCFERHLNVAIDANAYAHNIREIESFAQKQQDRQPYTVIKICLKPPTETLFSRVRTRTQIETLHQGMESDLERDLKSSHKKIDLNDYALIIDTEKTSFETELKIVEAFLEPYLTK